MMRVNPVIHFRAEPATQRLLVRLREERAVNVSAWLRQVVQQSLEKEFPDFVDYLADPAKPDPQKTPIKSVDVTDTAAEAGSRFPTALTQAVYEAFVEWTEDNRERSPADQDEAGRLSDIPEPDPQKTPIEAVDVTDTAAEAGSRFPTAAVYEAFVEWTEDNRERSPADQDEAGRLSDIPEPDPQKTPIEAVDVTDTAAEAFVEWTEDNRERSPADQDEAGRLSDVPEPDPQKTPIEGWRPRRLPGDQWGARLEGPGVAALPDDNQLPGTPIVVTDKWGESWTTTLTEVVERTDTTIVVKNSGRPSS